MTGKIDSEPHPEITGHRMFPCALCGQSIPHGAVVGRNVELAFKAREEVDGTVWWPFVHGSRTFGTEDQREFPHGGLREEFKQTTRDQHIALGGCPDPTPEEQKETEARWRDPMYRAEWKAKERERRTALREGQHGG